jgi:hypothetical protein
LALPFKERLRALHQDEPKYSDTIANLSQARWCG